MRTTFSAFTQVVSRALPRAGLVGYGLALLATGTNAALAIYDRIAGTRSMPVWERWAVFALAGLGLFVAWRIALRMVGVVGDIRGFLRFAISYFIILLPSGVGLILALIPIGPPGSGREVGALAVGALLSWILIVFLAAWPTLQAVSATWVSPLRVLNATRGHRVALFMATFLGVGSSKLLPDYSKIDGIVNIILLGIGHAVIGAVWILVVAAIGVAAREFAIGNDPRLQGGDDLA